MDVAFILRRPGESLNCNDPDIYTTTITIPKGKTMSNSYTYNRFTYRTYGNDLGHNGFEIVKWTANVDDGINCQDKVYYQFDTGFITHYPHADEGGDNYADEYVDGVPQSIYCSSYPREFFKSAGTNKCN